MQMGNDVTVGGAGFFESNNKSAYFSIGRSATIIPPGLSFSYSNGGPRQDLFLDENYTNYQNIHNFQIHFETDGSVSYYIYDLGDGTGNSRATRTLVASGNISNDHVPSGNNFLRFAGASANTLGGNSNMRLFNFKLLLRLP